ncbi:MAG: ABC transporter substrate-binding protein [Pigmentiphaga sp.]|nr:ABC transporter substrate-binding protein [Pigmentiphaga sp.]
MKPPPRSRCSLTPKGLQSPSGGRAKTDLRLRTFLAATLICCSALLPAAHAKEVTVGVTISMSGPGASLGIPTRNVIQLFPQEVDGRPIRYVVLDDASDATNSVRNFRRLIDEHNADVVMGSSTTPATMPLVDVAAEKKVPLQSLAASVSIVEPQDDKRRWVFKAISNERLMVDTTLGHMARQGVKTLGFIGFADAYGDSWVNEVKRQAAEHGIQLVAEERYQRNDTSVTAQTLKIMAARPDAVLVAGAGTPGALPQKTLLERGYKGRIYQTYGIANRDFLRLAGRDAEGAVFAAGPVLVAEQLNTDNPIRAVALDLTERYEAEHGPGSMSIFVANAWDSNLMLRAALSKALESGAEPGTPAFRAALRDALEGTRDLVTSQGVMTITPEDHVGYDERAVAIIQIRDGQWQYLRD